MKKILVFVSLVLPVLVFMSCKKEGVFNPDKKITQVYTEGTVTQRDASGAATTTTIKKYKSQEWSWDGKLLTEMTSFDSNGTATGKQLLSYDGKRLVKVSDESEKYYTEYKYKSGKLTSIIMFSDGEEVFNADVIHEDGKITKLKFSIDMSDMDLENYNFAKKSLSFVIPDEITTFILSPRLAKSKAAQSIDIVANLTYIDGNVTKITVSYSGFTAITVNCTYDKKHNPLYGCYANIGPSALSKNNIVEVRVSGLGASAAGGMLPQSQICAYTYTDDDYPETMTTNITENLEDSATRTTKETTTYVYGE